MKEYVTNNIRYLREKNSLTCERLAGMVGLHTSSINYIENGKRKASKKTLKAIADLFHVDINELCYEDLETTAELDMLYHSDNLLGYVIEYSSRDVFEATGEKKKALCTQKKLVWILERPISFIVWSAHRCNISHYVKNNPEIEYFQK